MGQIIFGYLYWPLNRVFRSTGPHRPSPADGLRGQTEFSAVWAYTPILEHFRCNISDYDAATGQTCVYGVGYCRCGVSDDGDWYGLIYRIHFVQEVHMPQVEPDIGEDSHHQIHPPWQPGGQVE